MHRPAFFYIKYKEKSGERIREKNKRAENGGRKARYFHLSMISDEKKIGQTSDVFKNASKRFKALKYMPERLVYQ